MVYAPCVDEVPLGEDSNEDRTREFQQRAKDEDEIRRLTVIAQGTGRYVHELEVV